MEFEDDTLIDPERDLESGPAHAHAEPPRTTGRHATERPPGEVGSEDWGSPRIIHNPIPVDDLDRDAASVVRRLTRKGHTAYLVGGCVRDLLLGLCPKDFDIATSARPRQVKRIFRNCRVIGRRFRLAHVIFGQKIIEVSTFRQATDDKAGDSDDLLIRDDNVFGTPREDARRRDFTINGLFYDLQQGTVIDYVGGLHDIERRTLRMIGDPDIRFQEDPIRILRAIKFAARLGVHISPKTMEFIEEHRDKLARSAPPRILEEILRMARGIASRKAFDLMCDTGVLEEVLPDVADGIKLHPERQDVYRGELDQLDTVVRAGVEPTAPVVFGVYLLPLVFPPSFFSDEKLETRPDGLNTEAKIEEVLGDLIPRLRLSRRDAGRLRQILMAQRRLAPSTRKRRFSRSSVAKQAYFPEALTIFKIHCHALGKWADECERWQVALDHLIETGGGPGTHHGRGGRQNQNRQNQNRQNQSRQNASTENGRRRPARRRRRRKKRGGGPAAGGE